ncbi:hypothetical protein RclHR1_15940005 [Rhizophagus clarus]|uniref:Uncharacterized protein n=1 Tax=Rhizophagus clarus TaxID=94130 RepID=A0A2Z6R947_9GLOM|nr:hypothetical protein RclHR1_15940005 [Rhizophagus clarus]
MLYFDLTGDASVTSNTISCEVKEKLRLILTLADPDIIFDLQTNNRLKGTKFNEFWDELEAYFNKQNLFAVDKRRHGTVLYIPFALSVYDLHKIIKNGSAFSFVLQMLLQHEKFCIQYCQWTCLILANDKHKIPIEEKVAVFTEVQNRCSLVTQDSVLAAADHDFTKLSLIPSVIFFILIPNDISESFYNGQVFVSYKDTVFKLSSAIQHSAEFLNALNVQYEHQILSLILCLYTDEAVHTAPNYSWTNPAECFMSILNIGLQDNTDHYATFQDVYGTETTEEYRPTYMKSQASAEPILKSILVVSKICNYINCEDCEKRHCVYSEKSLTHEEQEDFQ